MQTIHTGSPAPLSDSADEPQLSPTHAGSRGRHAVQLAVRAVLSRVAALYHRVRVVVSRLAIIHAAYVPHDESKPHAHALTSTILFNGATVSKIYAPGLVPRAIYWLAFQAPFPYVRNQAALRAAVLRRNLAGLLTEYWYGSNRVATALGIDAINGRYAISSEFVPGGPPSNRAAARHFLFDLADRFDEAGLPTWQVDPRQPRALDNLIETPDGVYHIIDLESGLVSPLASPRAWWRAFRRAQVPLYDDVYFDLTRAYIDRHAADMRARMGDAWVGWLRTTLDRGEAEASAWHAGEPRIWSRLARGLQRPFRRHRRVPAESEQARASRAQRWLAGSIATWETEGRLTPDEAVQVRAELDEPQVLAVLPHFGVHLAIGIVLRFPIGSIMRATYTLVNLLLATGRLLLRRIDRATWRQSFGIHSPLVILIAGMPGIGTFAYLASRPLRSNHLLLRVGLDAVLMKLPKRVYERTGLRWIFARPQDVATEPFQVERPPLRLTVWAQSIVLVLGLILGALFAADLASQVINASGLIDSETIGWSQIARMLDLGAETSFGTWYQVMALVFLALLLAAIGLAKRQAGDRFTRHWFFLALLALGFSVDEQVKLHDAGGVSLEMREQIGILHGPMYYGWIVLGLLSVIIIGISYRRFLADLPRATRRLFLLAALLFVGGEVALEMVSGWYADLSGSKTDLLYQTITSFEEFFGMAGILVAIAATLHLAQAYFGELRLSLYDGVEAAAANATRPAEPAPSVALARPRTVLSGVPADAAFVEMSSHHE